MEFIEIATLSIGQSGKLIIIIIILNLGESQFNVITLILVFRQDIIVCTERGQLMFYRTDGVNLKLSFFKKRLMFRFVALFFQYKLLPVLDGGYQVIESKDIEIFTFLI